MQHIKSSITGIDQGSLILFSDFEDGGVMWTGDGPRALRRKIKFSEKYRTPPIVHISLSMWDMDQKTNMRADISTEDITESGFTILFQTWGDTRIARVRANWFAIGEAYDENDWDVE